MVISCWPRFATTARITLHPVVPRALQSQMCPCLNYIRNVAAVFEAQHREDVSGKLSEFRASLCVDTMLACVIRDAAFIAERQRHAGVIQQSQAGFDIGKNIVELS